MKIKSARAAHISNYEVLRLLEENQEAQKQAQILNPLLQFPEQLRTVQFELNEYLKQTPVGTQSKEQLQNFLQAISKFELTKAERLQIINLRPKSTVEIYLVIEECEERFSEEDLEQMLLAIVTTLPRDDDEEEEEEEAGGDYGEEAEAMEE